MKASKCNEIELIEEIEFGVLEIETLDDLNRVRSLAEGLSHSQGFYGRLLLELNEYTEEDLPINL